MIKTVCLECRVMTDRGEGDEVDYNINMSADGEYTDEQIMSSAQQQFLNNFLVGPKPMIGVSKSNNRPIAYNNDHVTSIRVNNAYIRKED